MARLSVIINTYNRREILLRCLDTLTVQSLPASEYEIVVVDDGSTDATLDAVIQWRARRPNLRLQAFSVEHRGYSTARNSGIRAATGELVLFMGDDILLWPETLEEHVREHDRFPSEQVGVLGYVCWDPSLQSPLTDYAAQSGFGFESMLRAGVRVAPWHALYTCNVSLKRALLERAGGFNEALLESPYDDTELGYRLARDHGLILRLNYNAGAFHYHPLDSKTLRDRLAGRRRLMQVLFREHPELVNPSRRHLRLRYRLLNLAARLVQPMNGALNSTIRLLTSLRQRGWEGYPVLRDYQEIRCDALSRPSPDESPKS